MGKNTKSHKKGRIIFIIFAFLVVILGSYVFYTSQGTTGTLGDYNIAVDKATGSDRYVLLLIFGATHTSDTKKAVNDAAVRIRINDGKLFLKLEPKVTDTRPDDCGPTALCFPNDYVHMTIGLDTYLDDFIDNKLPVIVETDGLAKEYLLDKSNFALKLYDLTGKMISDTTYYPTDVSIIGYSNDSDARKCRDGSLDREYVLKLLGQNGVRLAETKYPGISATKPEETFIINSGNLPNTSPMFHDASTDCTFHTYSPAW